MLSFETEQVTTLCVLECVLSSGFLIYRAVFKPKLKTRWMVPISMLCVVAKFSYLSC